MTVRRLTLVGLDRIGHIAAGDDLAALLLDALAAAGESLQVGDILAVAQKIVSKAEGRTVPLASVVPSTEAEQLAEKTGKDARLVELLLRESQEVVRQRGELIIVEDVRGMVLANAGIDASNVDASGENVLLLPADPDASARKLRKTIAERAGVVPAVVIIDSIGRAWRQGTIGTAIGVAGMPALLDLRGKPDMFGRPLLTSELGLADEVASAASIVMGQSDEGCPAVLIRGLDLSGEGSARDLIRPRDMDMFR